MSRRKQLIRRRFMQSRQFRTNRPKVDGIERKPMEVRIQPKPAIDPTKPGALREAVEVMDQMFPDMKTDNLKRRASALFKQKAR